MTRPDELAAERTRRAALVRAQNDALRRAAEHGLANSPVPGRLQIAPSLGAQGAAFVRAALAAVARADPGSGSDGRRGVVIVTGPEGRPLTVAWTIDLHAPGSDALSEAPHDPARTVRTLTVTLDEEA